MGYLCQQRKAISKDENIDIPPVPLKEEYISGYVALTGKIVNISDVYETEEFDFSGPQKYDNLTGYRTKSMLVIPLKNHLDGDYFDDDRLKQLEMAGWLHDIGKISIPLTVMNKETRLDDRLELLLTRIELAKEQAVNELITENKTEIKYDSYEHLENCKSHKIHENFKLDKDKFDNECNKIRNKFDAICDLVEKVDHPGTFVDDDLKKQHLILLILMFLYSSNYLHRHQNQYNRLILLLYFLLLLLLYNNFCILFRIYLLIHLLFLHRQKTVLLTSNFIGIVLI